MKIRPRLAQKSAARRSKAYISYPSGTPPVTQRAWGRSKKLLSSLLKKRFFGLTVTRRPAFVVLVQFGSRLADDFQYCEDRTLLLERCRVAATIIALTIKLNRSSVIFYATLPTYLLLLERKRHLRSLLLDQFGYINCRHLPTIY